MPTSTLDLPRDSANHPWKELYFVVRADEKLAVERALQCVMPPTYSMIQVTGRGREGGLVYARKRRRRWWPFGGERTPAVLLPNVLFYAVIPEEAVGDAIRSVRAALRGVHGRERARGVAFVLPLVGSVSIDAMPRRRVVHAEPGAGAVAAESEE